MREGQAKEMEYHGIAMGGRIYALRMAKGMTQEQLAAVLCVSPAAVSKWERNLANPNIEMLWTLADYFSCTIDELVGRTEDKLQQMGVYDKSKARMALVAEDLLKCCELARKEGLLAVEEAARKQKAEGGVFCSGSSFLTFAICYFLYGFKRKMDVEQTFALLRNYAETLPVQEQAEGRMIAAVLELICEGVCPEVLRENIASYVGMGYWEKMAEIKDYLKMDRKEVIEKYRDKQQFSEATGLLKVFDEISDFEIQTILRNLDDETFTVAMAGAAGKTVMRFLSNVSDTLLYFLSEDIDKCQSTEAEIVKAQRRVLEAGAFVWNKEG